MDRASDFGSDGWEFESLRAHLVVSSYVRLSFGTSGGRNAGLPAPFRHQKTESTFVTNFPDLR